MRKTILTVVAASLAAAGASLAGSVAPAAAQMVDGPEVSWKMSLWGKRRAFTEGAEYVSAQVAERTGGKFTIKLFYGQQLSKSKENLDGISLGAFEAAIFCASYHPGKNAPLNVLDLPFLPLAHLVAGFDLSNPPLDNREVRRALAHTFPHEDVHQGLYLGHGEIASGFGPSSLWQAPPDFPRYRLDLDRARSLLEEAGFGEGFELDLALSAGVKETVEAMSLWQARLARVKVRLNIRQLSSGAVWDYAFNPDNDEYDVFVVTASGDVPSPYPWLVVYTSSPYGWMPYVGYDNPEFDRLVFDAWALEATDAQGANALWVEAQRLLHDDAASIFVMDAPVIFAYGDDLAGFEPNPPYSTIVFWYELRRRQESAP